MIKRCSLTAALLIFVAGPGSFGQAPPLKAEIRLPRNSVKNGALFAVFTAIRNTSREEQSLEASACGYGSQWTTDNPVVRSEGEPCLASGLARVKLKPGESYEKKILVSVTLPVGSGPKETVTFRLGFESERDQTAPPASTGPPAPRLWSNPVTINATR
jgi:hypothetical protein